LVEEDQEKVGALVRRQKGFSAAKDIDAYIVILPGTRELTAWPRRSYGMGLVRSFYVESLEAGAPMVDEYSVHALYYIAIVDGRTLDFIAGQPTLEKALFESRFRGSPAKMVDANDWAQTYAALSPQQKDNTAALLKELIASSMPDALKHLGLVR
jgi:hypothetical protein